MYASKYFVYFVMKKFFSISFVYILILADIKRHIYLFFKVEMYVHRYPKVKFQNYRIGSLLKTCWWKGSIYVFPIIALNGPKLKKF